MRTEEFDYTVRLATPEDVPAIVETALTFWHESNHSENHSEDPEKYATFLSENMINRDGVRVIIAEVEGKVVAYHIIYVMADYKNKPDGEMYQFYVHPDYRGTPIARDLVEMAVQHWDDWGCDVAYAIASPEVGNIELSLFRNLFAKFGFKETGIVMTRRKGGE